jgi:hypothetical protein
MRRMMALTMGLVLLCNGVAAQVSTRQKMIDTADQVAKVAYCVGLFGSPTTPAAEHLEIGGHISQEYARKFFDHVHSVAPSVISGVWAVGLPTAIGGDEDFAKQLVGKIERAADEGKRDASRLSRTRVFQQYDACTPLLDWRSEAEVKAEEQRRAAEAAAQLAAQQQRDAEARAKWEAEEPARRAQQAAEKEAAERLRAMEAAAAEQRREERRREEAAQRAEQQAIMDVRTKMGQCVRPIRLMEGVQITFIVDMNQDGTVAKATHQGEHHRIPGYQAAVDALYQTITDRRCQPWSLTKKKYVFQFESAPPAGKLSIVEAKSAPAVQQAPNPTGLAALTASELEVFSRKLRACISQQDRHPTAIIPFAVDIDRDGTPIKASLVDNGRYNSDPTYRAAADAAHRAIMNPRCGQWALPPAKYESWRKMRLDINPQD